MIRKIEVHIDEKGKIESANDSFLGVSGETGASEVEFILSDTLVKAIKDSTGDTTLFYRFEVTDAQGRYFVLENNAYENDKSFSLKITNAFTEFDGKITVSLVFESEGFTLCTLPVDFKVEKGCGKPGEKAEVKDTIVTLIMQAESKMSSQLNEAEKHLSHAQTNAENLLLESTALAETINNKAVSNANAILENAENAANRIQSSISQNLEQSNTVLNECEQRKNAAESASISALQSANEAANSKAQAEMILSAKEDISNKETNLLNDLLPNHTKYPSARAVQELVDNFSLSFSKQLSEATESLESTKAEKSELALTKQELAEAKAEIERLKTAEDFEPIAEIVCDGATAKYTIKDFGSLKKLFIIVRAASVLDTTLDISCYANKSTGVDNAMFVSKANSGTRWFRFHTERIDNGLWNSQTHTFSSAVYNSNWLTTYIAGAVNYVTALYLTFKGTNGECLPEGSTIKIYGVKS